MARRSSTKSAMQIAGATTQGRRERNEDSYWVQVFSPPRGELRSVAAVADGVGGQRAGDIASKIAISTLKIMVETIDILERREAEQFFYSLFEKANREILLHSKNDVSLSGMGSTLTVILIFERDAVIGHIGDSRCYEISENQCVQLTNDHTALQDSLGRGIITMEDFLKRKDLIQLSHQLLRNLGSERDVEPDITSVEIRNGAAFLICSDGLTGDPVNQILTPFEIAKQVKGTKNAEQAVRNLLSIGYMDGSTDNITVALITTGGFVRSSSVPLLPDVESLRNGKLSRKERNISINWTKGLGLTWFLLVITLVVRIMPDIRNGPIVESENSSASIVIQPDSSSIMVDGTINTGPRKPVVVQWAFTSNGTVEKRWEDETIAFDYRPSSLKPTDVFIEINHSRYSVSEFIDERTIPVAWLKNKYNIRGKVEMVLIISINGEEHRSKAQKFEIL